jgi:hypothetical protein
MTKWSAVFLMCFAFAAVNAFAGNILVNPGFESGALAPFFNSNDYCSGCTWSVTSTDSHTGSYSALVVGNRLLEQDFTAVSTSLITEASLWLKMPDTGLAAVYFLYSDSTTNENLIDVPDTWTKFDMTSYLAPGKSLAGVGVYGCSGCGGEGQTFADDFLIDTGGSAVPEPSTLFLLGFGGAALALGRRFARA